MAIEIACTSSRSACKAVITGSFGKLIFSEIYPVHSISILKMPAIFAFHKNRKSKITQC